VLQAKAEKGRIVLEPKAAVDSGISQSFADFGAGRTYGPFETAQQAIVSMKKQLRKPKAAPRRPSA
jgi:hypothetical protein